MPFRPLTEKEQPPLLTDTTIWRYLDFAKFAAMLSTGCLFFCQVARLGDPFEGSLLKAIRDGLERAKPEVAQRFPHLVRTDEEYRNQIMAVRSYSYASCWHANEGESAAMWNLYARGGTGIAVRSTVGRLIDSVATVKESVWIGQINYLDYSTHSPRQHTVWTPMLQKRLSFQHEREIRALVIDQQRMNELRSAWRFEENPKPGRNVPVNLEVLIDEVRVAPQAPEWYRDTVLSVASALRGGSIVVKQSELDGAPIF